MSNQSLEQLKAQIRPRLKEYLVSRGVKIESSDHFLCICQGHKDHNTPSGHIVPESDGTHWVCFGCGATGDIFTAAFQLEGLPLSGPEFLHENVYVLAQRFGIPYEPIQMSEEELYVMKLRQLYRHAADTLVEFQGNRQMMEERGWSAKLCFDMRVGVVPTWQEFRTRLLNKGDYTVKFLEEAGIYDTLFNPYVITFTMFDEFGNPVGFSARDSRWGKVQNIKKFRTTEVRIPIFKKMEVMYGFHLIRTKNVEVTLVEGFADVLTAIQAGLEGFVGYLNSEPTDDQVVLLQKYGKNDVVLAADYDAESKTGQEKTEKMIDQVLSGKKNLRIRVVDLSPTTAVSESTDPDSFLRKQADPKMAWTALPKQDGFAWRLARMRGEAPDVVCERMLSLILNEPQRARQEMMLKDLSNSTGIRLEALQGDLDSRLYETDKRKKDEAVAIKEDAFRKLKYLDPCKADEVLDDAARKIKALRRDTRAITTVQTSIEMVDTIVTRFLNKGEGLPGLRTGWSRFDERMGGMPKEDCYMVIGGIPHTGKTSWFSALAWNVARMNEDVCVLYMSVDDSMAQIYPKFVSIETGIPITWVAQPRRYLKGETDYDLLNKGWREVKQLIQTGRLEVRDTTYGNSVNYLEGWIDERKKTYKNRHIIAVLDNFHKLGEGGDSIRERFRNASEHLKNISQSGRTVIAVTAELIKGTDRKNPSLQDLMETVQLEHDATIAGVFHNDMQADPGTDIFWVDESDPYPEDRRKPIVDLRILKNKNIDGAFKGSMKYFFDPKRSVFREMTEDIPVEKPGAGSPVRSAQGTLVQGTLIKP